MKAYILSSSRSLHVAFGENAVAAGCTLAQKLGVDDSEFSVEGEYELHEAINLASLWVHFTPHPPVWMRFAK